jgi:hypothetical protein
MNIEVRHHHHYHGDDMGGGILMLALLLLLVPPLLPVLALECYSWVFMTAHHWHPVFKGTVALAEFIGVVCALTIFCAIASDKTVAWASAAYMGTMYGGFTALDVTSDRIWIAAIVVVSGAVGYGLGTAASRAARREDSQRHS